MFVLFYSTRMCCSVFIVSSVSEDRSVRVFLVLEDVLYCSHVLSATEDQHVCLVLFREDVLYCQCIK